MIGVKVFVGGAEGTAEVANTPGNQAKLEFAYQALGGPEDATPRQKLTYLARRLGKLLNDMALDELRRQKRIDMDAEIQAVDMGDELGGVDFDDGV